MNIKEYIKQNILYLDGGMGTLLQAKGLAAGQMPERWNLSHPEVISEIHRAYFDAGSNLVAINTFGANPFKFDEAELDAIVCAAVHNAREAAEKSSGGQEKWIALDVGPLGKMLSPLGDLDFEDAVSAFSSVVRLGVKYGVDAILIETMNDSYETKAALLAAKENSTLPVFVSCAFGEDGKLMTGASPEAMVAMLEGMGADAIGVNCSLGPNALAPIVRRYLACASVPILLKPNAGLPKVENGKTVFDITPEAFADAVFDLVREGVSIVGGCCGTTPEYILALVKKTAGMTVKPIEQKNLCAVSSYTHAVNFGEKPILIGERINPTGKKRFQQALREGDTDYILNEGLRQQEAGVDILDVNVGLPDIDEKTTLEGAICALQTVSDLPLQIDTSDPIAMERALRRYNGKALINSVSGKKESMESVFPLAKKYGGVVVALTLDENGIPESAQGRIEIAKKILETAKAYGLSEKDLIFDPLALTVSADKDAARATLEAVSILRHGMGCQVSLGVSNVSFGLPMRDLVNGTFFTMALTNGLSAAIMNPFSSEMMKAYRTYLALAGLDENCAQYIEYTASLPQPTAAQTAPMGTKPEGQVDASDLQTAIIKGLCARAGKLTEEMLCTTDPLAIIANEIVPALDLVGEGFEKKTVYLPQLLMSAEAAGQAFSVIKRKMPASAGASRGKFVIATVKGDIHDIGKNIVRLLLENYGFAVTDLGKDVAPEEIVRAVKESGAKIVGLSALMTTTVPSMEETIRLLRAQAPDCKVVVGGAVLNEAYAEKIGADKYAKDAMETVRYAEKILG